MYLVGSFIVALAMMGNTAITQLKAIPNVNGAKTTEHIQEENKILKVFVMFLLLFSLIVMLQKFTTK